MKRLTLTTSLTCLFVLFFFEAALATNGVNLIGVGPSSRAMGGVGIAAPQDILGGISANPAALVGMFEGKTWQVDAGATFLNPIEEVSITNGGDTQSHKESSSVYAAPGAAIATSFESMPELAFALGAYATSGLGVDHLGSDLDNENYFAPGVPLAAGVDTLLGIVKISPSVAYEITDWLSLGVSLHIDYSQLDAGSGISEGWGLGGQIGAVIKPFDTVSAGISYISAQAVDYDDLADFNSDGTVDDLTLESPQQLGFGVAWEPLGDTFLVETDVKWLNWSDTEGWGDLDWQDQWVFNVGFQYRPISPLALRLGYCYAENPVKEHTIKGASTVDLQGVDVPSYYFETLRVIGLPGFAEHHLTAGVDYDINDRFSIHGSYLHAFESSITETGTNVIGGPCSIESSLAIHGIDLGFKWKF